MITVHNEETRKPIVFGEILRRGLLNPKDIHAYKCIWVLLLKLAPILKISSGRIRREKSRVSLWTEEGTTNPLNVNEKESRISWISFN